MLVLGIESSCDETALCLLRGDETEWEIIREGVSSQEKIHVEYGGVVPELAAREHLRNLPILYERVVQDAKPDCIAVTTGPGLKGCLLMGSLFAQGVALGQGIPVYGINHIEGHLLAPLLDNPELKFPFLALIVSGGHTEIQFVRDVGDYELYTRTIDDAAGEAFDKSAHLLGFPYPGGPQLAALADRHEGHISDPLPEVMKGKVGFSFSGLKTAIALKIKGAGAIHEDEKQALAATIQEGIVSTLIGKLEKAMEKSKCHRVVVTGGVAANILLRKRIGDLADEVYFPKMSHCMDNAAMIAFCALQRLSRNMSPTTDLTIYPRWPIETSGENQI